MPKWDYKTVVLTGGFMGRHKEELKRADLEKQFDGLGQKGWELSWILMNQSLQGEKDGHVVIFKRPYPARGLIVKFRSDDPLIDMGPKERDDQGAHRGHKGERMKRRITALLAVGVASGIVCGSALADPPAPPNGHNCGGFASTFVPPGLGPEVSGLAQAFPTAIPTSLDFANCGGNGFPP